MSDVGMDEAPVAVAPAVAASAPDVAEPVIAKGTTPADPSKMDAQRRADLAAAQARVAGRNQTSGHDTWNRTTTAAAPERGRASASYATAATRSKPEGATPLEPGQAPDCTRFNQVTQVNGAIQHNYMQSACFGR